MNLESYISDIDQYKEMADGLQEDNPAMLLKKIEILSKCLSLIGDVSAECDRLYKRIHVKRDTEYAKAYISADRPKKENDELAITAWRQTEAEAYGRMQHYRNEFDSTREIIHSLKLKMKMNFADGTIGSRYQGN
jgi:hypothetical protein